MADSKISDLTAATTPLSGTELAVVVQSGVTKQVAVSEFEDKYTCIQLACSDETTDLTVSTTNTFRMAHAMTLTDVRASLTTAATGATFTVDIKEGGVSILSTLLTIDATEKTSTTAVTPVVISDSSLADDAEMSIEITVIGSTIAGAGLKVSLIGTRA